MDWSAFFEAAGLARSRRSARGSRRAVNGLAALVASRPLETWKDYLRFHAIDDTPTCCRAHSPRRRCRRCTGDRSRGTERALAVTQSAMAGAIGELYAERYFPPAQKARVRPSSANVARRSGARRAATWLSPASRAIALAKLDSAVRRHRLPGRVGGLSRSAHRPDDAFGNCSGSPTATIVTLWRGWPPYDPHEWVCRRRRWARS